MRRTCVWVSAIRNSVIHKILSEFLQPFRKIGTPRVAPFFPFNMWTWHTYWMGIYPLRSPPCSSLTVAWHSCGWWSRRASGRCRMINLLSWRCHWCWRMRTGGRTRWQARNHDRNEVLCVALYPNTVVNEMWFLTIDPVLVLNIRVHRKAFAKLS